MAIGRAVTSEQTDEQSDEEELESLNDYITGLLISHEMTSAIGTGKYSLAQVVSMKLRRLLSELDGQLTDLETDISATLSLMEASGSGVVKLDPDAHIKWASSGALKLFAKTPSLYGTDIRTLLADSEEVVRFEKEWDYVRQMSRTKLTLRFLLNRTSAVLMKVWAIPIRADDGSFGGARVLVRDFGTSELQEKDRLTRRSLEDVGMFAADLAHDFNNAICAIIGSVSLLELRLKTDHPNIYSGVIRQNTEYVKNASERAAALVRKMMKLSPSSDSASGSADVAAAIRKLEAEPPVSVKLINRHAEASGPFVKMERYTLLSVLAEALRRVCERCEGKYTVETEVQLVKGHDLPFDADKEQEFAALVFLGNCEQSSSYSGSGGLNWFEAQRAVLDSGGFMVEDNHQFSEPNSVTYLPVTTPPASVMKSEDDRGTSDVAADPPPPLD
ncbi:MAG: histidine kinase dimerization/phospho-acceptor domain-containing protein [Planctomycetota bacterium]|nr:histidine kinase dimerization/phospho-acceptor domain-containing protein [Planctomycetota bacterium]